jgi:hypothetical protein
MAHWEIVRLNLPGHKKGHSHRNRNAGISRKVSAGGRNRTDTKFPSLDFMKMVSAL